MISPTEHFNFRISDDAHRVYECEVAGQSGTGLWKLYLQSIIYQKYFPVT